MLDKLEGIAHEPLVPEGQRHEAKYVIVGGGPAGWAAVHGIQEAPGFDPSATERDVILITDEQDRPLFRPAMSKLQGLREDVALAPKEQAPRVLLRRAQRVDPVSKEVLLADGSVVRYDKLLIATGMQPDWSTAPLIPTAARAKCLALHSATDYARLEEALKSARDVSVLGSGFVGCELAGAMAEKLKGVNVTLLSPGGSLLDRVLPEYLGKYLAKMLKQLSITVRTSFSPVKISSLSDGRVSVISSQGAETICDLLILDLPPRPLAVDGLLHCNGDDLEGVRCKDGETLETSHDSIFAAGDVACHYRRPGEQKYSRLGHYEHAVESGRIAGFNMARQPGTPPARYPADRPHAFWSELPGMYLAGVGSVDNALSTSGVFQPFQSAAADADGRGDYKRGFILYFEQGSRTIRGVLLINLPEDKLGAAREIVKQGTIVPHELSALATKFLE